MKENWFRVHTSILDSRKFENLSLAARGLWVTIGALVKERGDPHGRLVRRDDSAMDAARLAREIGYPLAEVESVLGELIAAGLLEYDEDGFLRLHDWEEWQVTAEQREEWRERQRRHRNGLKQDAPVQPEPSECHAPSRDVTQCHAPSRDVTQCHAPSRDVTQCHAPSRDVTQCHVKNKNKTETENENNALRAVNAHSASFQPRDEEFVMGKYQKHGLSPPSGEQLRLEIEALLGIEREQHVARSDISRAIDYVMAVYRGDAVRKRGAAFRTLRKQWNSVQRALDTASKKEKPILLAAYHRLVEVPAEWLS